MNIHEDVKTVDPIVNPKMMNLQKKAMPEGQRMTTTTATTTRRPAKSSERRSRNR